MKVKLQSSVPTVYQSNSIGSFGIPVKKNMNGSFSCTMECQTKKDAIKYMLERAEYLAESPKELKEMKRNINKYGYMSYDAATLNIIKENG